MRSIIVFVANFTGASLVLSQCPHNGHSIWFVMPGILLVAMGSYYVGRTSSR